MYVLAEGPADFDTATITGNSATSGGAAFIETGIVSFIQCDLGSGNTENLPDDVYIGNVFGYSFTGYASNTDLVCDATAGACL